MCLRRHADDGDHAGAERSRPADGEQFAVKLAGRRPAVFVDYGGVLTPIVDRPEDAVMSAGMREAVQALAQRCSVCVISGRDRPVVQPLRGVDNLVVAGSHGFDIWSRQEPESTPGTVLEPKRASVAVHYRLAHPEHHTRVTAVVGQLRTLDLGDDIPDEDAFRALAGQGVGIFALSPPLR